MSVEDVLVDTAIREELHHAIILHGPAATSLRDAALRIAKALNCLNGTGGDDCATCLRIERRIHPDVHTIEVSGERKMISVEQIRELVEGAMMRPYEGRTKVFIVDPADALSIAGSNSLLKTLEEPARNTTFILLTRSPDLLLPTIRSRSQSVFVGGVAEVDTALKHSIVTALAQFSDRHDAVALLSLAAQIAGHDDVKDAIALLGTTLCEAVAQDSLQIPKERLLAAADGAMSAIRWLGVNADARMLVEQALAELVK